MRLLQISCLLAVAAAAAWATSSTAASVTGGQQAVAAAAATDSNRDVAPRRLRAALTAIEAALGYMDRHRESVNLDGAIGVRIVEGQFGAMLSRCWTQLPLWLVARLKSIQAVAAELADSVARSVRRTTPEYFANAGEVTSRHHWDTFYPSRPLPESADQSMPQLDAGKAGGGGGGLISEKFSDDCVMEFLGKVRGWPTCTISELCWQVMAASGGHSEYYLTHQLLYLMSGIQLNCLQNLTAKAEQTRAAAGAPASELHRHHPLWSLMDSKCRRVFNEALRIEELNFPIEKRDLFMEQVAVCGTAGYTEIAQRRWLPRVIGWQRASSGCYGLFPGEPPAGAASGSSYGHQRRRKRAEAPMGASGCLSHRTSVALGALTVFVRREIEE